MIWSSNTYNTMHIHIWIFCKRICLVSYCGSQVIQIRVLFFINLKGDSMIWHMRSSTDQRLCFANVFVLPLIVYIFILIPLGFYIESQTLVKILCMQVLTCIWTRGVIQWTWINWTRISFKGYFIIKFFIFCQIMNAC